MATEATGAAVASATALMATMLPGVDGGTLIGAFSGAAVFVLSAKDGGRINRLTYGFISCVLGYLGAEEVARLTPITNPAIGAFLLSAILVTGTLTAIERIKALQLSDLWRR